MRNGNHETLTDSPPLTPDQEAETAREAGILHEEYLRDAAVMRENNLRTSPRRMQAALSKIGGVASSVPVGGLLIRSRREDS